MANALDLSLSPEELDGFLTQQRTVRLATVASDRRPHVVPLWYVWLNGALFMNSTVGNVTTENLRSHPRASGVVDDGDDYGSLRGAVLEGDVARAEGHPELHEVRRIWSNKYLAGAPLPYDRWKGRIWLRLLPEKVTSWDFRKIPQAKAAKARNPRG